MIEILGSLIPGGGEWIAILFVLLLLFGSKLPSIMRNLGGSVKEFKKGMEEGPSAVDKDAPKQKDPASAQGAITSQSDAKAPGTQDRTPT